MSDIVERLRSICQPSAPYSSQDILDLMREAADEIERLRARNGEHAIAKAEKPKQTIANAVCYGWHKAEKP
jgi:hypothetical protein